MNYRHGFHAGNFADVVKHSLLAMLLEALSRKPAPWAYLDTHAGAGAYDLHSPAARRTGEATGGICRLWAARGRLPPAAERLCSIVAALNPGGAADSLPRVYPGSPRVAAALARPGDKLFLAELHPEEAYLLRGELKDVAEAAVHERDGYEMLKALTPPKEKRGLVLMDPPYEKADEFESAAAALVAAHGRWPSGVYSLWYPIKDDSARRRFLRRIEQSGLRKVLLTELYLPVQADVLYGSGVLIVNPPWQLDTEARDCLAALAPILGAERSEVRWLVPE
ncbi:MAG TPA: 23S rRNA (adenine(2030)-N(6))-methyltransferase RlmJ [Gammaproteobacteria bacterium]|nr:23S rRNA (adenine(2030)-N(6))-methyltransferase RlmJ [Gammaproteobacteria bacterium]